MIKYLSKANPTSLRGTALLRLDFNTEDDWRMRAVLPTLKFLKKTAEKVVVISHKGRPEAVSLREAGDPKKLDKKYSLKKNAATLEKLMGVKVHFIDHFDFERIKGNIEMAPRGSVFLIENLRFIDGEAKNDPAFAKALASLGDYYVNDAFAVSHRANASVSAITKFITSYAGLELENEIVSLTKAMLRPKRPLVFVLGGAKAQDKLGVIRFFLKRTKWFLLGGGPANTVLSLHGVDVKNSVRDKDPKSLEQMKAIARSKSIVLPEDFVWSKGAIVDFGPATVRKFQEKIKEARTLLWSGPLGLMENPKFAKGTLAVARAVAKNRKVFSIAGGGETVMFLKKNKLDKKFGFISTGGGALIDFLAGKKLPGIEALK